VPPAQLRPSPKYSLWCDEVFGILGQTMTMMRWRTLLITSDVMLPTMNNNGNQCPKTAGKEHLNNNTYHSNKGDLLFPFFQIHELLRTACGCDWLPHGSDKLLRTTESATSSRSANGHPTRIYCALTRFPEGHPEHPTRIYCALTTFPRRPP
jgi:hypothetical protein